MTKTEGANPAPHRMTPGQPTGFRRLTLGMLATNHAAEAFNGLPEDVTSPGQVLAAFKAAAPCLGLSVRLVHAIDWLFRFTQPQDWEEGSRPIAWPSADLQRSALGLSVTQVKAINRQLIEFGLLTMRDSPNGKRYGTRDRRGRIVEAYGFDLAPLALRYAEFLHLAEAERQERALLGRLRRRLTIARKGIAQMLETVGDYGLGGPDWTQLALESASLVRSLRAVSDVQSLECGVNSLERRQDMARRHLETQLKIVDSDPKQSENRPHTTTTSESLNLADTVIAAEEGSRDRQAVGSHTEPSANTISLANPGSLKLAPHELVRLAPRLKPYLRGPDPSWRDVVDAADWLRDELDISKPLWGEACVLLGREGAAVALAVVSTKDKGHFRTTPGGYFNGMLAKAKARELNLDRTIWKLRHESRPSGTGVAAR